ncbi:MAG: hypothetical protein LBL04_15155 [Bacteroidales bacterium]|nr:hypothetical protein [Bacteroidales bacterium]
MNKYKKMNKYKNSFGKAMESGDHFKNGASPPLSRICNSARNIRQFAIGFAGIASPSCR